MSRSTGLGGTGDRSTRDRRLPLKSGRGEALAEASLDSFVDPNDVAAPLLRELGTDTRGLSSREAARRLVADGPNELRRRSDRRWPRELLKQLIHPLALLLWLAASLAYIAGTTVLAAAIIGVIVLNALFAFVQERQAERAVEALEEYLPTRAYVRRDGRRTMIEARELVPGDILLLEEGERISADGLLFEGSLEVDMSTLTGESVPVLRTCA